MMRKKTKLIFFASFSLSAVKGQIMLIIILTISSIFVIGAAISLTITQQLRRVGALLNSVKAFYAADAGVEWQFFKFLRDSSAPAPELTNNTSCCKQGDIQIISPELPGQRAQLKSIGTSPARGVNKVKRSIETNTAW